MENKDSSSSTCVHGGCCGAEKMKTTEVKAKGHLLYGGSLSTEFELGDGVDWVPDDEAEGDHDDLIWVRDDEENGVDVEANGDDNVIIEEVIEGGHGQDGARVEELEDSDEEVQNDFERKKKDKEMNNKVHEMVDYEGFADDGMERFIFGNMIRAKRVWKGQIEVYETKIDDLKKKLESVNEGFRVAIRVEKEERQNKT